MIVTRRQLNFVIVFIITSIISTFSVGQVQSQQSNDTDFFRELIEQKYRKQWFKAENQPFSMDVAEEIYIKDDELIAIDTDAYPYSNDIPSRIEGWDTYEKIWPVVFDDISNFRLVEILNFETKQQGDWTLVTFDGVGEGETTEGEPIEVFKNFTLIWTKTDDGWRIIHEHISDGRG